MKEFFQKSGGLLLIVAFLLTVLMALGTVLIKGSTDPISNAMGVAVSPFRNAASVVTTWGEGVYDFVTEYDQMESQVEALELEIAQLEEVVREGAEALRENEQLRELLSLQAKRRDFVFESAKVTAKSFTGWESVITLDKGSRAGVTAGDCVVTEAGHLVGVVTELGENWCHVATLVSIGTSIGGVVARTSSSGLLEGEFSLMAQQQLRLSYLPNEAQLVAGDQVLTSGVSDLYPEGLTVGKVQGVFHEASGISRYAVIVPDVDLNSLIQVFIVKDFEIVD